MCFPGAFPVTPKIIDLLIRDISLSIELTADIKEDARCGRMQITNEVQISDFTDSLLFPHPNLFENFNINNV